MTRYIDERRRILAAVEAFTFRTVTPMQINLSVHVLCDGSDFSVFRTSRQVQCIMYTPMDVRYDDSGGRSVVSMVYRYIIPLKMTRPVSLSVDIEERHDERAEQPFWRLFIQAVRETRQELKTKEKAFSQVGVQGDVFSEAPVDEIEKLRKIVEDLVDA